MGVGLGLDVFGIIWALTYIWAFSMESEIVGRATVPSPPDLPPLLLSSDFTSQTSATPCRVWRSILHVHGTEVLEQDIVRRIGTGETTNIWNTNWIPRDGLFWPVCCTLEVGRPQRVSELIDHTTGTWNNQLLEAGSVLPTG